MLTSGGQPQGKFYINI